MGTNPKASYSGLPASVASREMEETPVFLSAQKNHRNLYLHGTNISVVFCFSLCIFL